ncbi:MAG TPA: adenylate/guanylate cyclase domain-containing protein [Candidatus Nitrosotalea sp.]|nr:adenylate/guanylate cyclase domain-containing protein [Candidatus Nitrosotalea sp.]
MSEELGNHTTPGLERKLATILSADVAEYSRLMANDEEQTLRTFRAHAQVFESLVLLHRGRIFNRAGDAILAEFSSAVEAVRCATEIQAALRTRNEHLPATRQVRFRIGVNLGDVVVQGTDLLGDGVNVAARLQAAAEPGGICVSGSVYDQIRNKLSLSFKSLGEQSFKNIPQPVRTFSIADAEGLGALPTPKARRRGKGALVWVAAVVLAVALGSGYWAYSQKHREQAEQARVMAEAAKQETARRDAQLIAAKQAAGEAQRQADVARQQAEAERNHAKAGARRVANEQRQRENAVRQAAAQAQQRAGGLPPSAGAARIDGVYAGSVCYGPSPNDPARCYRAEATVREGKIAGEWHGRDPGVTVKLAGEISAIGEVKIEMHAEREDGQRFGRANLSGTVQNGRLDASGFFFNGRTASLSWRRD